jgi:hypothetical protein
MRTLVLPRRDSIVQPCDERARRCGHELALPIFATRMTTTVMLLMMMVMMPTMMLMIMVLVVVMMITTTTTMSLKMMIEHVSGKALHLNHLHP